MYVRVVAKNQQTWTELNVGINEVWFVVVELKVLLVDQPLDGCGDEILQVGFCMSIGFH